MGLTIFEIVLGAIVAILITILIEKLRKPNLRIKMGEPVDQEYKDRPARFARFLVVEVLNKPLPRWARWMTREAATQCHGTITFYHLDGQNVFGRIMPTRWSSSPEPLPTRISVDDKVFLIAESSRFAISTRTDIYPGEPETSGVVARFDDDEECYGWSNENYFSDPIWRNPDWRLPNNRYLVKVVIITAGEKVSKVFRLINDVPRTDFRLEPKMSRDKIYG